MEELDTVLEKTCSDDVRQQCEDFSLGIDEAGRGPVLGPMVYGCCYCPTSAISELQRMQVADSKELTLEQRETRFAALRGCDVVGYRCEVLRPEQLSRMMLRPVKYNLNAISHDTAIALIEHVLGLGVRVRHVYVDTVGPPETYQYKLRARFPEIEHIVVAKKADSLYPPVSAASICAKVVRDRALEGWQFRERGLSVRRDFGSGYPGDPTTKQWLRQHCDPVFGFPGLVRFSWATADALLQELDAAPVQWPDYEWLNPAPARGGRGGGGTTPVGAFRPIVRVLAGAGDFSLAQAMNITDD